MTSYMIPYKIDGYLNSNHMMGPHYVFNNGQWWVFHAKFRNPSWCRCHHEWGEKLAKMGHPTSWLEVLVVSGLSQTEAERMK